MMQIDAARQVTRVTTIALRACMLALISCSSGAHIPDGGTQFDLRSVDQQRAGCQLDSDCGGGMVCIGHACMSQPADLSPIPDLAMSAPDLASPDRADLSRAPDGSGHLGMIGDLCGQSAGGLMCAPSLACCYPCGIPNCNYVCQLPCKAGPGCNNGCPLVP